MARPIRYFHIPWAKSSGMAQSNMRAFHPLEKDSKQEKCRKYRFPGCLLWPRLVLSEWGAAA
jgi:hypothetical protein